MAEYELRAEITELADRLEKEISGYQDVLTDNFNQKARGLVDNLHTLAYAVHDNYAEITIDDSNEDYEDRDENIITEQSSSVEMSSPILNEDDVKQIQSDIRSGVDNNELLNKVILKILDSQNSLTIMIQKQNEVLTKQSELLASLAEERGFKETAQAVRETAADINQSIKEDCQKLKKEEISASDKIRQLKLERKELTTSYREYKHGYNEAIKEVKENAAKEKALTIGGVLTAPLVKSFDLLKSSINRAREFTHFCKEKVHDVKEQGLGAFKKLKEHMNERKLAHLEKRSEKITEYKNSIKEREGFIISNAAQRNERLVEKANAEIRRDNNLTELKHNLGSAMKSLGNVFRGKDNQRDIDHEAYKQEFKPMLNPMTEQMGLSSMTKFRIGNVKEDLADIGMKNVINNQKIIATKVALAKTFDEKQQILADACRDMFESSNLKRATFINLASGDHLSFNPDTHEFRLNNNAVTPEDVIRKISPVDFYNLNVLSEANQIRSLYREAIMLNDKNVILEQLEAEPDLNVNFVEMIKESLGFDYTVFNKEIDQDVMKGMNDEVRDILNGTEDQGHEDSFDDFNNADSGITDAPELE